MSAPTAAPTTPPARWREVFAGARGRLTAGLLLLEALVATQILVVATVMPAVRSDLGGLVLYGWTFSASGLGQFAAIPIAGHAVDRFGPRRLLAVTLVVYSSGLVLAALAPSMLVLVLARLIQGVGGGAVYAVSLATVAKRYPEALRARVLALLAAMWILPGLLGPPLGAILVATVGWRFAFAAPLPLLVLAAVLTFPALGVADGDRERRIAMGPPLALALGAGALLAGLTIRPQPASLGLVLGGLAVAVPALGRIVPAGTFAARAGLPAAAAAAFLLSASFAAADSFATLMLTAVNGRSVAEAGLVLTAMTVAWSLGSWWQSRAVARWRLARLLALGTALLVIGLPAAASALAGLPLGISYAGWTLAGVGMGIAFPTIPLSVMNVASHGQEASELSATLLMDTLGIAMGAGLGGSAIALADVLGAELRLGIAGAFGIGLLAALVLLAIAGRLPEPGRAPLHSAA
jgi:MFS family permease